MALHILKDPRRLSACLKVLKPGDALVLIDRAVYLLSQERAPSLAGIPCPIHALTTDLALAGIDAESIGPGPVAPVDYTGWVSLTEIHPQQCLWS